MHCLHVVPYALYVIYLQFSGWVRVTGVTSQDITLYGCLVYACAHKALLNTL